MPSLVDQFSYTNLQVLTHSALQNLRDVATSVKPATIFLEATLPSLCTQPVLVSQWTGSVPRSYIYKITNLVRMGTLPESEERRVVSELK